MATALNWRLAAAWVADILMKIGTQGAASFRAIWPVAPREIETVQSIRETWELRPKRHRVMFAALAASTAHARWPERGADSQM
jgi:hypothetical protein